MPRKINESATVSPRTKAPRKSTSASDTATAAPRRHSKATPVAAGSVEPSFSYEEVATLAYSYWEARGYQPGNPEEDWLRAESELRSRTAAA